MREIYLLILLFPLSIFFCGPVMSRAPMLDDSAATPEGVKNLVQAINQFGFELYSKIKDEERNIFFSPYSISIALAMTYEGARGKTAEEIKSVFHFPEDEKIRRPSLARIYNQINKREKKYKLHTANALWAQKDYPFLKEYINIIENYYAGKITNLDFVNEREKSRKIINNWVEEKTEGKIKDLIPPSAVNSYTRLVLTNAIYFKGNWLRQFDEKRTREEDFRVSSKKTVKVPMMQLTKEKFNYTETEKLQVLELPYEGEELSMLILLPKKDDIHSIDEYLNVEKTNELKKSLRKQEVNVFIPRFKFETKYLMSKTLSDMGMPTAFSDGADFSGMDGTRSLIISNVIHQAFIEVNEEGTEAAAATGVVVGVTSVGPRIPVFRADHPFIFIIQERETGSILFLGRVVNPVE